MRAFYSDVFELALPPQHRFPMSKYRLLRDRVEAMAGVDVTLATPPAASLDQLALVHEERYLRRVCAGDLATRELRRIGFPWSPQLVERSRQSVGSTIAAARAALVDGVAANLAGGTHHASADAGQGYCVFNDVAVAIRTLQSEQLIERAMVVDCDVHQGNGTAAIFAQDESVFTFSMHGARNFPYAKVPSNLDIALPCGTGDRQFLDLLDQSLALVLPLDSVDLVFYLAGADAYHQDRLGRLRLSKSGLERRDRYVLEECRERQTPVAIAMAGGYAPDIDDTVSIHATTVRLAAEHCWRPAPKDAD